MIQSFHNTSHATAMLRITRSLIILIFVLKFGNTSESRSSSSNVDPKIIIVGAGVSGVAAAVKLIENGFKDVVILEAESRMGGRINTIPFASNVVDLGAQWCHGEKGNVVYELASKHNLFDISASRQNFVMTRPTGDQLPIETTNELMDILFSITEDNKEEMAEFRGSLGDFTTDKYWNILETAHPPVNETMSTQVLDWYHRYINSKQGCPSWYQASAPGNLLFSVCEGEQSLNWKDKGFGTVFDLLMNRYPEPNEHSVHIENHIQLNKKVTNISWRNERKNTVVVTCTDGSYYEADHVIVTSSLGVLKAEFETLFSPALPPTKTNAIKGLGMGLVNKMFMEWKVPFWPKGWTNLDIVWDDLKLKGLRKRNETWMRDIVSFDTNSYQPNILMGWIGGDGAREMEALGEKEVFDKLLALLRQFLPHMTIPNPIRVFRTRWHSGENFRGSYSFRSVLSDVLNAYAADLAAPLLDIHGKATVQFAGEATHEHFFSTVHGAIESGWREADRIDKMYP